MITVIAHYTAVLNDPERFDNHKGGNGRCTD